MVLPALIAYLSFMVLPYIVDIYYSFTKYQGVGVPEFTGLKNYVRHSLEGRNLWLAVQ